MFMINSDNNRLSLLQLKLKLKRSSCHVQSVSDKFVSINTIITRRKNRYILCVSKSITKNKIKYFLHLIYSKIMSY